MLQPTRGVRKSCCHNSLQNCNNHDITVISFSAIQILNSNYSLMSCWMFILLFYYTLQYVVVFIILKLKIHPQTRWHIERSSSLLVLMRALSLFREVYAWSTWFALSGSGMHQQMHKHPEPSPLSLNFRGKLLLFSVQFIIVVWPFKTEQRVSKLCSVSLIELHKSNHQELVSGCLLFWVSLRHGYTRRRSSWSSSEKTGAVYEHES